MFSLPGQQLSIETREAQVFPRTYNSGYSNLSSPRVHIATLTSDVPFTQDTTGREHFTLSREKYDHLVSLSQNPDITARGEVNACTSVYKHQSEWDAP